MFKRIAAITIIVLVPFLAFGRVEVQKVFTQEQGDAFITNIEFNKPVDESTISLEFIDRTIQVNIPDADIPQKKHFIKINKGNLKSVYTFQESKNNLRSRIVYKKSVKTASLKPYVKVYSEGNSLKIVVDKKGEYISRALPKKIKFMPPLDLNKELENALKPYDEAKASSDLEDKKAASIVAQEMNLVKPANKKEKLSKIKLKTKKKQKLTIAAGIKDENLPESEIPVFVKEATSKSEGSSTYTRMILSLVVVVVTGFGILVLARWWGKGRKKSLDNNKIRVLTQHYLGPKKSLAIIRVAGEHILLGLTDQNISMIKTLALIDDDFPETIPNSFGSALKNSKETPVKVTSYNNKPADESEEFSIGHVKDVVSEKLKNLRTL